MTTTTTPIRKITGTGRYLLHKTTDRTGTVLDYDETTVLGFVWSTFDTTSGGVRRYSARGDYARFGTGRGVKAVAQHGFSTFGQAARWLAEQAEKRDAEQAREDLVEAPASEVVEESVVVECRTITRSAITAELAQINADNAAYGLSDGRVTRENALREGLQTLDRRSALREERARADARRAAEYSDPLGTARSASGTTHFLNGWGEPFCGTRADLGPESGRNGTRATCRKCQQAGDALKRDGFPTSGGSAARR